MINKYVHNANLNDNNNKKTDIICDCFYAFIAITRNTFLKPKQQDKIKKHELKNT